MKRAFSRLNWRHKVALLAFALGFFGLFAGSPYRGIRAAVNPRELALSVHREEDHVAVNELAEWLIQGRADFRLLDLRGEADYGEYHIPSAEHVRLDALVDYPIVRNEKIVLYSEGGIHSAQAWFLLQSMGFRQVYLLRGGLEEWQERILFPRLADTATAAERAEFEKVAAVSRHFGGTPQAGGAEEPVAVKRAAPKLSAPSGGAPAMGGGGKKKKEGC